MMHLHKIARRGACALGIALLLTACGSSTPDEPAPPAPAPAAIQGIATPSSVSVVTATHAD